jgi:ribosomal protein L15
MTDMSKYKNVSLQKETYSILEKLSKVLSDGKLSISKTIEVLANKEARKLNGKIKKNTD